MPNEINMDVRANGLDDLLNKTSEVRDNLDGIDEARENLTENQIKLIDDDQMAKIRQLKQELQEISNLQRMLRGKTDPADVYTRELAIAGQVGEISAEIESGVPLSRRQQQIMSEHEALSQRRTLEIDSARRRVDLAQLEKKPEDAISRLQDDANRVEAQAQNQQDRIDREVLKSREKTVSEFDGPPDADERQLSKKRLREQSVSESEAEKLERQQAHGVQQMARVGMQQMTQLTGMPLNALGMGSITGMMAGGAALGVGAIAGMGMFANMIADYSDRAREPGAQYFGIVQQIAAATGKSSALVSAELLSGAGGNLDKYGVGIDQRANYAHQMSQVFGSNGTQAAWLGTANFALRAGIDPSIVMGQISTMKRSVDFTGGDMIGFLQQMDTLRGMGHVGGRAGLAIENVATMAQAQVGISGVMPDVAGVNAMTEAYAGLAGTGESGANLGGKFEAKFAGGVAGASGPTNAFMLRAFMADPSVKSHTLEEFEYWKEQVLANKKVHYIMDYARKEFGNLAPIALKRMGLATISESREYESGRPVGVGKGGISPDASLPGPIERTNLYKISEERFSRFEAYDPTWEAKQTSREIGQALRQSLYKNQNTMGNLLDQIDPLEQVMVDPEKGYQNIRQALGPTASEKDITAAAFNAGLATYREANTGILKVEFSEEARRVFVGGMRKQPVGFTGFCNIPEAN